MPWQEHKTQPHRSFPSLISTGLCQQDSEGKYFLKQGRGGKKPSGLLPCISHKHWNKAGLKRKRDGYKTRGGKKKLGKEIRHATQNKYFTAQAGAPRLLVLAPVMERSLPIAWWLPALGGEDVPSAPLPSHTGHIPALCNSEVLKSPHASKTIILQHLCFEPGCVR